MKLEIPGWLKQKWWKYTSLVLLFYILVGGLIVPLSPGIESVSPINFAQNSDTKIEVHGHNTHFSSAGNTQVVLKHARKYYCVEEVIVKSDDLLYFNFIFNPDSKEAGNTFDVIVNNNTDGTIALREAIVYLKSSSADSFEVTQPCEPSVGNNLHTGFSFPYREILYESIRNTFYHVPMWFSMMLVLIISLIYSIKYLRSGNIVYDVIASEAVNVSLLCGVLGLTTGMIWANYTWGSPWPNDPKLNGAAVGVLIYVAYLILRGAIADSMKRARISAVYNIFAIVIYIMFIFIIPRITDSLHPGNGGNPAFSKYDLDSHLRVFFYPAVIGWVLLFTWIISLRARLKIIEIKKEEDE
jgi:heme exporter protein C